MKFLCTTCQKPMRLTAPAEQQGEGITMTFVCETCGQGVALQTNPGEADLLHDLGLRLTSQPGGEAAPPPTPAPSVSAPIWTEAARQRLEAVPGFIRPMIRKSYETYAREHGFAEITPAVMDAARAALDMGSLMGAA
ncbi:MAG: hypothetical protein Fur0018_09490 [Anaerolineales bacterium]